MINKNSINSSDRHLEMLLGSTVKKIKSILFGKILLDRTVFIFVFFFLSSLSYYHVNSQRAGLRPESILLYLFYITGVVGNLINIYQSTNSPRHINVVSGFSILTFFVFQLVGLSPELLGGNVLQNTPGVFEILHLSAHNPLNSSIFLWFISVLFPSLIITTIIPILTRLLLFYISEKQYAFDQLNSSLRDVRIVVDTLDRSELDSVIDSSDKNYETRTIRKIVDMNKNLHSLVELSDKEYKTASSKKIIFVFFTSLIFASVYISILSSILNIH